MQGTAVAARRGAMSFFARLSYRRLSIPSSGACQTPASSSPRRNSIGSALITRSNESLCSSSVASSPSTPFSPVPVSGCSAAAASVRSPIMSPETPDGFYGFGDDNDDAATSTNEFEAQGRRSCPLRDCTEDTMTEIAMISLPNSVASNAAAGKDSATCHQVPLVKPESPVLVMARPSQSSLLRRRELRANRPKSCPILSLGDSAETMEEPSTFQMGDVSSSRIFRRRKAASLQARPRTADCLDDDDCAFGFDHEFTVTAPRWRGVKMDGTQGGVG